MAFTSPEGRTQSSLAEINITPLVDVMLVLLIIFMVTAPLIQSGIEVNLPQTRSAREIRGASQAVVTVEKAGGVFVMSRPAALHEVADRLKREVGSGDVPVYLQADGEVPFALVVKVMDALHAGGFTKIQVVTKPLPRGGVK